MVGFRHVSGSLHPADPDLGAVRAGRCGEAGDGTRDAGGGGGFARDMLGPGGQREAGGWRRDAGRWRRPPGRLDKALSVPGPRSVVGAHKHAWDGGVRTIIGFPERAPTEGLELCGSWGSGWYAAMRQGVVLFIGNECDEDEGYRLRAPPTLL